MSHITECHYPKSCDEASCSHLPGYGVELDQAELDGDR